MLTGFALDIQAPYQIIDIPTNASVSTNASVCFEDNVKLPEFAAIAKYFVIVLAVIELLLEILEMKLVFSWKVWIYFMEKENILEWPACICSIIFVVNTSGCTDTGYRPQWQWTCGTISVFLAWINLLLLIQKFDWIGIYVVMLYRISKVFMKFFLVFSLLIVAFAVTFHCLLRNQEQFSTFWISLVKTTEMMIGELDYTSIFIDAEVHYNVISHVFFYIFMLFMTIVVVNLMVGLAVDKIREFQKEAVITKKEMQIKFALELERPSISWIFEKVSSCLRFGRNEDNRYSETLQPSKHNWLQKKIGESWKLTEKDIKEALNSGRDGASTEITELKTDMKKGISKLNTDVETMKEEMKNINTNLMTIINNLKRPEDTASASRQPADY